MQTTVEFLNAVKARHGLTSDYQLGPFLGLTRSAVSKFRSGKDFLGDETAMKVAKALEIDPAYVMACAHAERAKGEDLRATWRSLAEKLGGVAATVLLGVAAYTLPAPPAQAAGFALPNDVYYVKRRKGSLLRSLLS